MWIPSSITIDGLRVSVITVKRVNVFLDKIMIFLTSSNFISLPTPEIEMCEQYIERMFVVVVIETKTNRLIARNNNNNQPLRRLPERPQPHQ